MRAQEIRLFTAKFNNQPHTIRRHLIYPIAMHSLMILGVLLVIFPLIYAAILSTQSPSEYYQIGNLRPGTNLIENYSTAWTRANLGRLIINTFVVALLVPVGKIVLSIGAAFALVYFKVRGSPIILAIILLTHLLPLPVRIVPTYELLTQIQWVGTFQGLTVPFLASATGVLLFRQFFRTLSTDLVDAARVDGAGPFQFLFRILIPISRTNIGALFLIEFIYMWNQYLWPLIVANSINTRQIQIGIKQLIATDSVIEWGILMAGTMIIIIPPLILLLLLQGTLMNGLTSKEDT